MFEQENVHEMFIGVNVVPAVATPDGIKPGLPIEFFFCFYNEDENDRLDEEAIQQSVQKNLSRFVGQGACPELPTVKSLADRIFACSAHVKEEIGCEGFVYVKGGIPE